MVLIASAPPPPPEVTVTFAVDVVEPVELVAVRVYVVVAVGLTLVEPVAELAVKVPGVIAIDVAPLVDQFKLLLDPEVMLPGLAENEWTTGLLPAAFTVMVIIFVEEPAVFVAVNVYVIVAVGLTLVDPLARVDVKVPGIIAILAAPLVAQFSVVLAPAFMVVSVAPNDEIAGTAPCGCFPEPLTLAHPPNPSAATKINASPTSSGATRLRPKEFGLSKFGKTIRHPRGHSTRRSKLPLQVPSACIRAPFPASLPISPKCSYLPQPITTGHKASVPLSSRECT